MLKKDVVKHFGSQGKLARALNISQPSVANWPDIIPPLWQVIIENVTKGKFKASHPILRRGARSEDRAA